MIQKLSRAWKNLLANDNATLGIDADFTRPGVEALLGKLEQSIADEESIDTAFNWGP